MESSENIIHNLRNNSGFSPLQDRISAADRIEELEAKVEYVKSMGLEFGIMKTTNKPEGFLQHKYRENSELHRMNKEWQEYYSDNLELLEKVRNLQSFLTKVSLAVNCLPDFTDPESGNSHVFDKINTMKDK